VQFLLGGLAFVFIFSIVSGPLISGASKVVQTVTARNKMVPIYKVGTEEKKVSISFDACWGAEYTDDILNVLDKYGVKTTFFLVNIWLNDYPEIAKKISNKGHELGMHTVSHPHLNNLSEEQIRTELVDNRALIEQLTGQKAFLFRPPFGEYSNKVLKVAESEGIVTIQWSIDSLDWVESKSKDDIVNRVLKEIGPGDIVLFHNNGQHTAAAIVPIIEKLQADGYQIVPISQLIYKENYYIDSQGTQRKKK
jgi:polysaccharide deacetylase family sporulation protein PdaB